MQDGRLAIRRCTSPSKHGIWGLHPSTSRTGAFVSLEERTLGYVIPSRSRPHSRFASRLAQECRFTSRNPRFGTFTVAPDSPTHACARGYNSLQDRQSVQADTFRLSSLDRPKSARWPHIYAQIREILDSTVSRWRRHDRSPIQSCCTLSWGEPLPHSDNPRSCRLVCAYEFRTPGHLGQSPFAR